MPYKNTIILDIDETLIHSTPGEHKLPRSFVLDFGDGNKMTVQRRPYLGKFLSYIFRRFTVVGVWTAATRDYANDILDKILTKSQRTKLAFVLSRDVLFEHQTHGLIKDLRYLWAHRDFRSLNMYPHNTIIIDDKHENGAETPGNLFHVQPFLGDQRDRVLLSIIEYFNTIFGPEDNNTYLYLDPDGATIKFSDFL
jgi:TFIIF-interacting CTD phosphatase-like protein